MVTALANQSLDQGSAIEPETPLRLSLDDLIADDHDEIVIYSGEGIEAITIVGGTVTHAGTVEFHVTAAGDDVAGFQFITFDNGITLYHEASLAVTVAPY
jgi:hypothetical protein